MADYQPTPVSFSESDPEVYFGQIRDVLLCEEGYPLADDTAETLLARIDNSSSEAGAIRRLAVVAQKLSPQQAEVDLSHDRITKGKKRHRITGYVDETNDTNYNFLVTKSAYPSVMLRMWYTTPERVYGGLSGILCSVTINHVVPESNDEIERFELDIAWVGPDATRLQNPLSYAPDNAANVIGTIQVFEPENPYKSGSNYVTFSNPESPVAEFRKERLFRCIVNTLVGESPETQPSKWLLIGDGGIGDLPLFVGVITHTDYTDNLDGSIVVPSQVVALVPTIEYPYPPTIYNVTGGVFALVDQVTNYIVVDYNAGSPVVRNTQDVSEINEANVIPVYTIFRTGNTLHATNWDSLAVRLPNKLHESIVKTQRYRRQDGLAIAEYGNRNVDVSAGVVYVGANKVAVDRILSDADGISYYARSAGEWIYTPITQYNNTEYSDGTNTLPLTTNRYTVNWLYRGIEDAKHLYMVLGTGNYILQQAQSSQPPANLPIAISSHALLIGRIIVQKDSSTAQEISSAFDVQFTPQAATIHNDLSGLNDGDYKHLTAALYGELIALLDVRAITDVGVGHRFLTLDEAYSAGYRMFIVFGIHTVTANMLDPIFLYASDPSAYDVTFAGVELETVSTFGNGVVSLLNVSVINDVYLYDGASCELQGTTTEVNVSGNSVRASLDVGVASSITYIQGQFENITLRENCILDVSETGVKVRDINLFDNATRAQFRSGATVPASINIGSVTTLQLDTNGPASFDCNNLSIGAGYTPLVCNARVSTSITLLDGVSIRDSIIIPTLIVPSNCLLSNIIARDVTVAGSNNRILGESALSIVVNGDGNVIDSFITSDSITVNPSASRNIIKNNRCDVEVLPVKNNTFVNNQEY